MIRRRDFTQWLFSLTTVGLSGCCDVEGKTTMYGIVGKIISARDRRDELIEILLQSSKNMPGCLSYGVSRDKSDSEAFWVCEVWDSQQSHIASLNLEAVKQAITKGRPLIASFGERFEMEPVGGYGLARDT